MLVLLIAGLVDVDAIGLTLARKAGRGIDPVRAERAIVLAAIVIPWPKRP